jgi:hypothetical protein
MLSVRGLLISCDLPFHSYSRDGGVQGMVTDNTLAGLTIGSNPDAIKSAHDTIRVAIPQSAEKGRIAVFQSTLPAEAQDLHDMVNVSQAW